MLRIFKWYLFLKMWDSSKLKILSVIALWTAYIFTNQFLGDLIAISQGQNIVDLIYIKWVFISFVIGTTCLLLYRIYCDSLSSLGIERIRSYSEVQLLTKKEKILSKPTLKTKGDVILEKYQSIK